MLTSTAAYKMLTIYRQQTGILDVPAEGRDEWHGEGGKVNSSEEGQERPHGGAKGGAQRRASTLGRELGVFLPTLGLQEEMVESETCQTLESLLNPL